MTRHQNILSISLTSVSLVLMMIGWWSYNNHYLFNGMILFGLGCMLFGSSLYRPIGPYHAFAAIIFGFLFIYYGIAVHGGFQ